MVARQDGNIIICVRHALAAETDIPPLQPIENMLIIHKWLKIEGMFLIEHVTCIATRVRSTLW